MMGMSTGALDTPTLTETPPTAAEASRNQAAPLTHCRKVFCGEKWGFDSVGTANKEKFGFDQGKYLKPVAEFNQRQTQRAD